MRNIAHHLTLTQSTRENGKVSMMKIIEMVVKMMGHISLLSETGAGKDKINMCKYGRSKSKLKKKIHLFLDCSKCDDRLTILMVTEDKWLRSFRLSVRHAYQNLIEDHSFFYQK